MRFYRVVKSSDLYRKREGEQAARDFESIEYKSPYTNFIKGAEWADETMIDKAIKFFQSKSKHGMIEENINVLIDEFCKVMKGE